jgi:hypothetical protein
MHASKGLASFALLAFAGLMSGQTAEISGRVVDATEAVVPDADITATNTGTGLRVPARTNESGSYRIRLLPPGSYSIAVQKEGFKPVVQPDIVLVVDQVARIDFTLQVGAVTEAVEVSASAVLLESESANVGQVVTSRTVEEMPLNGRDPMFLITLTPGVTTGSSFGASRPGDQNSGRNWFKTDFSVGGGRNFEQEVLLDGAPNTSSDRNYGLYIPPVDSTQEFKVLTNPYSAEYGRTGGGLVSMITKSGSNEYHGVAYEFTRNSALDSNQFFNNRNGIPKTTFRRHQFGVNFGGPIFRNRTFFFADYEGYRQAIPATFVSTVPTSAQRAGDFSAAMTRDGRPIVIYDPLTLMRSATGQYSRSPFPGNAVPQDRFDPVAAAVIPYYPEPNVPGDPVTGVNNYVRAANDVLDANKGGVRIDHSFSQNNRLFGRYSVHKSANRRPGYWEGPSGPANRDQIDDFLNLVVADTHTFSSSTVADVRLGAARGYPVQSVPGEFDPALLKLPQNFLALAHRFFPMFSPADMSSIGNAFINIQPRDTYSLTGSVSKLSGSRSYRFGAEARVLRFGQYQLANPAGAFTFSRLFTQGPDPLVANSNAGFGFASLLLGAGSGGQIEHRSGLSLQRLYYAAFVQHDWRVSRRLTLNFGLRYDLTTGTNERYDRLAWLDLTGENPLASVTGLPLRGRLQYVGTDGNRRNQLETDSNNFNPRAGFAWQLGSQTVIRGGYGIFFVPMTTRNDGAIGFNSETPWVATIDNLNVENYLRDPFPRGFNLPRSDRDPATNAGFRIDGYIGDEPVGYAQQWNLSIQRQIGADLLVDASYWGNKGTKLAFGAGFEENFLPTQYLALGARLNDRVDNPFYGLIPSGSLSGQQVTRRQLLLPYPQYTSVLRTSPSASSSIYHAFTLKAEKRAASGLSLLASYTASKIIGDSSGRLGGGGVSGVQNMENRRAERHILTIDVPQRLVTGFVYDLPFGRGRRLGGGMHPWLNAIAGGWRLSGIATFQSGFPVDVSRPSVNNGSSAKLDHPTIQRWYDTSVFAPAPPFTFGNVGPTLPDVRMDGVRNFDFTVGKDFRFRERYRLQFRTDFFNATNTPHFGEPVSNVTNAAFGQVTSQANEPRQIQFALKLYW